MVERERELLQSLERASFFKMQHPSPLFIEFFRVGEDPVQTGRISDCCNPQSWPFGLPVLLLLRSLHPDVRFD